MQTILFTNYGKISAVNNANCFFVDHKTFLLFYKPIKDHKIIECMANTFKIIYYFAMSKLLPSIPYTHY